MAERKVYQLSEEDWNKLLKASHRARNTLVIALSSTQALAGNDFASQAYKSVDRLWAEMADKYGFDVDTVEPISDKERKISAVPKEES